MSDDRDLPDSANRALAEIHECVGAISEPGSMTIRKRVPYKPMAERISHFATARLVREQSPGFRRLCALSRRFDESKKGITPSGVGRMI